MHFYLYDKYDNGNTIVFGSFSGNIVIDAFLEPIFALQSEQIQILFVRCEVRCVVTFDVRCAVRCAVRCVVRCAVRCAVRFVVNR